MPSEFTSARTGSVPADAVDMTHEDHLERQAAIELLRAQVDRDQRRADRLQVGGTPAFGAGTSTALAFLAVVCAGLAVPWFTVALSNQARGLPALVPALIWAGSLVSVGLLLTDRSRPGLVGSTVRARRVGVAALVGLPLATAWVVLASSSTDREDLVPALLAGLLAAGLLVLPGFAVDDVVRRRAARFSAAAVRGRVDLTYLGGSGNGRCPCTRCASTKE